MDDSEFRTRAYSNPLDEQEDFKAAADATPERRRLLDELGELERNLVHTLTAVDIPSGLKQKLHRHAKPASSLPKGTLYAAAASMVVAAGLGLNLFLQPGPSAQDLALHDELINHLHQEAPNYENGGDISWGEVEAIMAAAGATLKTPDEISSMHMSFAKLCGVGGIPSAHLVTQGEHGPISIILIRATPVSTGVKLRDERFQGRIIPLNEGNMAVIGEKNESLGRYEKLLRENVEWSI